MTSADDIHAQIDAATRDHTVSPDAMRCGPAPDDEPRARHAAQVDRALRLVAEPAGPEVLDCGHAHCCLCGTFLAAQRRSTP